MIERFAKIKAQNFFLFFSIVFGTLFISVTPPFQVPDEINHFYKIYQISDGVFLSEKIDGRLGGYVPKSFVEITHPFLHLRWNANAKTQILTTIQQFSVSLHEEDKVFVDFPNTAVYTPVSYVPQSFIVFVLKTINTPPMYIFYITKLFMLLFWSICIWYIIKIIPVYKWLFALLALLPMSLYINSSFSADVVTTILAFMFLGLVLKHIFNNETIKIKEYAVLLLIAILLASAKFVYIPIILLFFLLRKKKVEIFGSFYWSFALMLLLTFCTALFWSKIVNHIYIPYEVYNPNYRDGIDLVKCANIKGQMNYIINNGSYILDVFGKSICSSFDMYYRGYIGTFGWVDTNIPYSIINLFYGLLFLVAVFENNVGLRFGIEKKIILVTVFLTTIILVLLSQHLAWDCVGTDLIANIQGRYFIPVFPLFFVLFNGFNNKYNMVIIVPIAVFFLLSYSTYVLCNRYYATLNFDIQKIYCDAETINAEKKFITSNSNSVLENGAAQSNKQSKSGKHSIKLHLGDPFGFTYKITNLKIGDELNIDVWRLGKKGEIILSGENGKLFYLSSQGAIEKDTCGWEKLHLYYQIISNIADKEIGVYIYNPSPDTSYFDDFLITKKTIIK